MTDWRQMYCGYCKTWQHTDCYGYLGEKDPRIPEDHACYECLLEKKEGPVLSQLRDLALLRTAFRAMKSDGGVNGPQELKEILRTYLVNGSGFE